VDIPHRAVIELAASVGQVLQDVERRLLVKDRRVETLALGIVRAGLAIDEGDQTFPSAARVDGGPLDIDIVCAAVGEGDVT
jgi:hypothetical protein